MNKILVLGILGSVAAASVQADISREQIDLAAAAVQPQVVEWRRWFHRNPELGNREFNTSAKVAEILAGMGLEPQTGVAHTGVVAWIEGGRPGPLVAIRADMDGLPVTEMTGLEFASTARGEYNGQEVGVMHACGHDTHMAMALGAARILNDWKAELPGSVMLIFQPAEEGPPAGEEGGAALMLKEGLFAGRAPEAVFGIHVGISKAGAGFAVRPGPMMAAADQFTIRVRGRQTHGAMPWNGVDPVTVSAQIVLALQTITSRQVDVTAAPSIISVGRIAGGIRNNVIPDEVEMEGTIRSFDAAMREYIHAAVERTAMAIAQSAGASAAVEIELGTPPLINDADLTARMMPSLQHASAGREVYPIPPQTVAEDFSEFANAVPGLYVFLGSLPEGVDPAAAPANHSPLFDIHEPDMEMGVRLFAHLVVDFLQGR